MEDLPTDVVEFAAYATHQRAAAEKYVEDEYFPRLQDIAKYAQRTDVRPHGYDPGWILDGHVPKGNWKRVKKDLAGTDSGSESMAGRTTSNPAAAGPATPRRSVLHTMGSALGGMIGFGSDSNEAETPPPVPSSEPSMSASPPSVFDESAVDTTRTTISPSPETRKTVPSAELALGTDGETDSSGERPSSRGTVVPVRTQDQISETGLVTPRRSTTPLRRPESLRGVVIEDEDVDTGVAKSPKQPKESLAKTNPVQYIKDAIKTYYQFGGEGSLQGQFKAVANHHPATKTKLRRLYGLVRGLPSPCREGLLQQQGLDGLIKHCTDVNSHQVVKNAIDAFLKDQDGEKLAKAFQTAVSRAATRQDKEDIQSLLDSIIGLPVLGFQGLKGKATLREMASYCQDYYLATERLQGTRRPSSPKARSPPPSPTESEASLITQPVEDPPDPPRRPPTISGRLEKHYPPRLAGEREPPMPADAGVLRYKPGFDYQEWFQRCSPLDRFGLKDDLIRRTATKNPYRPRCFSPYAEFDSAAERWIQIPDQDLLDNTKVWAYIRGLDRRNRIVVETESLDGRPFSRAWILPVSLYNAERKRFRAYMKRINAGCDIETGSEEELKSVPRPARKIMLNNVAFAPRNTDRLECLVEILTFDGWQWFSRSALGQVFNQKKVDEQLERVRPCPE